jgi:hypothetical protein
MSVTKLSAARRVSVSTISGLHVEAMDWASRVVTNGGSVSTSTLRAMSAFCVAIDAAGIRDRFLRANLFCGTGLSAATVPLYRSASFGGATYGNTTDTNNNFVTGDYSETGATSGLTGNSSTKYLNTGLKANALTASNAHLGIGLRDTAPTTSALYVAIGAYNNNANALLIYLRDTAARRASYFSRFGTSTDGCGPSVFNTSLFVGDIVAAYPTYFVNSVADATTATTSQDYPSAHDLYVFALNNSNSSVIGYSQARMNWYSIGLSMTSTQVTAFYTAVAVFNATLGRR